MEKKLPKVKVRFGTAMVSFKMQPPSADNGHPDFFNDFKNIEEADLNYTGSKFDGEAFSVFALGYEFTIPKWEMVQMFFRHGGGVGNRLALTGFSKEMDVVSGILNGVPFRHPIDHFFSAISDEEVKPTFKNMLKALR